MGRDGDRRTTPPARRAGPVQCPQAVRPRRPQRAGNSSIRRHGQRCPRRTAAPRFACRPAGPAYRRTPRLWDQDGGEVIDGEAESHRERGGLNHLASFTRHHMRPRSLPVDASATSLTSPHRSWATGAADRRSADSSAPAPSPSPSSPPLGYPAPARYAAVCTHR